jgi:hypothetical protein
MAGYTYYSYLTYLTELQLLIMVTYYKVLTWFLHVLLLCPRWPQSEHLIGNSSGSRNSLCRRSRLLRGRPGCRFVTAGGLVTPSYITLSMHAGKMLFCTSLVRTQTCSMDAPNSVGYIQNPFPSISKR